MSDDQQRASRDETRENAGRAHYLWFVVRLDEEKVSAEEKQAIRRFTNHFGEQAWQQTLIVLLHAKNVKQPHRLADMLKHRSTVLRLEIAHYTGWDIASTVPVVTTSDLEDVIPPQAQLVEELYSSSEGAGPVFYFITPPAPEGDLPSIEAVSSFPVSVPDEDMAPKPERVSAMLKPDFVLPLVGFFISCGPMAAIGMILAGPIGCGTAILINALIWGLIGLYRNL
jgi:hypothetical protein